MTAWLKEWLMLVIACAAVGTCGDAVLSAGAKSTEGVTRLFRLIATLCVIGAVLFPLIGSLKSKELSLLFDASLPPDNLQYQSIYTEAVVSECEKQLENRLSDCFFEEFGIKPTLCRIELTEQASSDIKEYYISGVTLALPSEAELSRSVAIDFAKRLCACDKVIIKESEDMG